MKAAVLKLCVYPFGVATGKEEIAVLKLAFDEYNLFQYETLVVKGLALINLHISSIQPRGYNTIMYRARYVTGHQSDVVGFASNFNAARFPITKGIEEAHKATLERMQSSE
jgi:hypothetical protein